MKYYTLSGYIAPFNKVPAFVIPVFQRGNELFVQLTTAADRIETFDVIADDSRDDLLSCTHSIKVQEGDQRVYAFALSEDDIYEGTKTSLAKKIAVLVPKLHEHPFTALQVFRFTNNRAQILDQILHIKAKLSETDPAMAEEWAALQAEPLGAAPGPNEVGTARIAAKAAAVQQDEVELHRMRGYVIGREGEYIKVLVQDTPGVHGEGRRRLQFPYDMFGEAGLDEIGTPFIFRMYRLGNRIICRVMLDVKKDIPTVIPKDVEELLMRLEEKEEESRRRNCG